MTFPPLGRKARWIAGLAEAFQNGTHLLSTKPQPVVLTENAGVDSLTAAADVFGTANKMALLLADTVFGLVVASLNQQTGKQLPCKYPPDWCEECSEYPFHIKSIAQRRCHYRCRLLALKIMRLFKIKKRFWIEELSIFNTWRCECDTFPLGIHMITPIWRTVNIVLLTKQRTDACRGHLNNSSNTSYSHHLQTVCEKFNQHTPRLFFLAHM